MLRRIKYWRRDRQRVKSLQQEIRKLEKAYAPLIEKEGEHGPGIAIDEFLDEISPYEAELERIKMRKLFDKATKLGIEIPETHPTWFIKRVNVHEERSYTALSELGEAKIRNLIRKQQREDIEWWLKVIGALTGLIGAAIGLVAILK